MGPLCFFRAKEVNVTNGDSVVSALIQATAGPDKQANLIKHIGLIKEAAARGAQIICLQELFSSYYFGAVRDPGWFAVAERIPGPTSDALGHLAKDLGVVLIAPIAEEAGADIRYNTALVLDADGRLLGKYRKMHLPNMDRFWEGFYFRPGDLGYPVFQTVFAKIGVLIDFDRHFPEVPRILALKGAQILYNPCTTVMDLSRYIWFIEQRAHAVASGVFVGTSNRVGLEPLSPGTYYGTSYFCDPCGEILAQGSQENDEIVLATLDLTRVAQEKDRWNFVRNRRPETYDQLTKTNPE